LNLRDSVNAEIIKAIEPQEPISPQ
jgi:hypothetical protein